MRAGATMSTLCLLWPWAVIMASNAAGAHHDDVSNDHTRAHAAALHHHEPHTAAGVRNRDPRLCENARGLIRLASRVPWVPWTQPAKNRALIALRERMVENKCVCQPTF